MRRKRTPQLVCFCVNFIATRSFFRASSRYSPASTRTNTQTHTYTHTKKKKKRMSLAVLCRGKKIPRLLSPVPTKTGVSSSSETFGREKTQDGIVTALLVRQGVSVHDCNIQVVSAVFFSLPFLHSIAQKRGSLMELFLISRSMSPVVVPRHFTAHFEAAIQV